MERVSKSHWDLWDGSCGSHFCFLFYFLSSPEDILNNFRERWREGERETLMWERQINWLPLICACTGNWTCNLSMCPTRKQTCSLLVYGTTFHTGHGMGATSGECVLPRFHSSPYLQRLFQICASTSFAGTLRPAVSCLVSLTSRSCSWKPCSTELERWPS